MRRRALLEICFLVTFSLYVGWALFLSQNWVNGPRACAGNGDCVLSVTQANGRRAEAEDEEGSGEDHSSSNLWAWWRRRGRGTHLGRKYFYQYGNYMVLSDFILSTRRTEPRSEVLSRVTLCTQTYDLKLLQEYLPEVVERWAGPVSLAIYAPHNDFYVALQAISYLRQCSSPGIKTWVTVHFIFDLEFWPGLPKAYHSLLSMKAEEWDDPAICNNKNSNNNNKSWTPSYRQQAGLSYPINIARNVARTRAYTYHILETELHFLLFPTNLEPKFVKLIKSLQPNRNMRRGVFVLPGFVEKDDKLRGGKDLPGERELPSFLRQKAQACPHCQNHIIPWEEEWWRRALSGRGPQVPIDENPNDLGVLLRIKRIDFQPGNWEPLFLGNQDLPLFHETIMTPFSESRRGGGGYPYLDLGKSLQLHVMCLLNYDFHVLSSPFFIKRRLYGRDPSEEDQDLCRKRTMASLRNYSAYYHLLYGKNSKCLDLSGAE